MSETYALSKEATAARSLLLACKEALGDDESAISDAIEGETNLFEAIGNAVARCNEVAAMQAGLKDYMKDLAARNERFEAQIERIRAAIASAMDSASLKKVELPHATISLRAAADKLGAVNETDVPSRFFVDQAPKLDRKALLAALKAGEAVPGAHLANGAPSIAIRSK